MSPLTRGFRARRARDPSVRHVSEAADRQSRSLSAQADGVPGRAGAALQVPGGHLQGLSVGLPADQVQKKRKHRLQGQGILSGPDSGRVVCGESQHRIIVKPCGAAMVTPAVGDERVAVQRLSREPQPGIAGQFLGPRLHPGGPVAQRPEKS